MKHTLILLLLLTLCACSDPREQPRDGIDLTDSWVKHPQMPDKVVRYIVDRCKTKETPSDVQQLIKQSMFK